MFGLIDKILGRLGLLRKKSIHDTVELALLLGLQQGLELGIQVGRYRAGDKGVILSTRVRQQVEKILENSESK